MPRRQVENAKEKKRKEKKSPALSGAYLFVYPTYPSFAYFQSYQASWLYLPQEALLSLPGSWLRRSLRFTGVGPVPVPAAFALLRFVSLAPRRSESTRRPLLFLYRAAILVDSETADF